MPDALPAATLPLYPGLGQASNMLAFIPSVVVHPVAWLIYENTRERSYLWTRSKLLHKLASNAV